MLADFGHCADFYGVYTREAHAADEWPLGCRRSRHLQHRSLDERRKAAFEFASGPGHAAFGDTVLAPVPSQSGAVDSQQAATLLVDSFGPDCLSEVYSTWPERAFILQGWPARIVRLQARDGTEEGIWTEIIRGWLLDLGKRLHVHE